jgi:hypothetical protein
LERWCQATGSRAANTLCVSDAISCHTAKSKANYLCRHVHRTNQIILKDHRQEAILNNLTDNPWYQLVSHLQRKASVPLSNFIVDVLNNFSVPFQETVGKNYGTSLDEVKLIFVSLIVREMADRLLMWWSGGYLDLPDCLPYSPALCVEKFGHVSQGNGPGYSTIAAI